MGRQVSLFGKMAQGLAQSKLMGLPRTRQVTQGAGYLAASWMVMAA